MGVNAFTLNRFHSKEGFGILFFFKSARILCFPCQEKLSTPTVHPAWTKPLTGPKRNSTFPTKFRCCPSDMLGRRKAPSREGPLHQRRQELPSVRPDGTTRRTARPEAGQAMPADRRRSRSAPACPSPRSLQSPRLCGERGRPPEGDRPGPPPRRPPLAMRRARRGGPRRAGPLPPACAGRSAAVTLRNGHRRPRREPGGG